jgi:hypothetical protein
MREEDALDAILERVAREEQEDLERAHGQFLLDIEAAARERRRKDPLLELLEQAHQTKPGGPDAA